MSHNSSASKYVLRLYMIPLLQNSSLVQLSLYSICCLKFLFVCFRPFKPCSCYFLCIYLFLNVSTRLGLSHVNLFMLSSLYLLHKASTSLSLVNKHPNIRGKRTLSETVLPIMHEDIASSISALVPCGAETSTCISSLHTIFFYLLAVRCP